MRFRRIVIRYGLIPCSFLSVMYLLSALYMRDCILPCLLIRGWGLAAIGNLTDEECLYLLEASKVALRWPEMDARHSLLEGNDRLSGVAGLGLFFPGVPDSYRNVATDEKSLAREEILGSGDCSMNRTDSIYQLASYDYALRYNRVVWPYLVLTMPAQALGIPANRLTGESYYWSHDGSANAPEEGTHVILMRLSIDHRLDEVGGFLIKGVSKQPDVVLEWPYSQCQGKAMKEANKIMVKYCVEKIDKTGNVSQYHGQSELKAQKGRLLFNGNRYEECKWVSDGQFYVTFCQFWGHIDYRHRHRKA